MSKRIGEASRNVSSPPFMILMKGNSDASARPQPCRECRHQIEGPDIFRQNASGAEHTKVVLRVGAAQIRPFTISVINREMQRTQGGLSGGPNPENDLRVFCAAGILPENIWAFESDADIHDKAVASALASEFPFIKIINGGLDTFLEASPMRFDIIYLDFCGPLPSRNKKQKTLLAISKYSLVTP